MSAPASGIQLTGGGCSSVPVEPNPPHPLIATLPSYVFQEIAGHLTWEEQGAFARAGLTKQIPAILAGIKEARDETILFKNFCAHSGVRNAWKAFDGTDLPTAEELANISHQQLADKCRACLEYIQFLLEDSTIWGRVGFDPYFLHLFDIRNATPQSMLKNPDMWASFLEGIRLDNVSMIGISLLGKIENQDDAHFLWTFSNVPSGFPHSKENLQRAAEITLLYLKNHPDIEVLSTTPYLWAIPPEMTALRSLEQLTICYGQMRFLPDEIRNWQRLRILDLHSCDKLKYLPQCIEELSTLETLHLNTPLITSLPLSMAKLPLTFLSLPLSMAPDRPPPTTAFCFVRLAIQSILGSSPHLTETEQVLQTLQKNGCDIQFLYDSR